MKSLDKHLMTTSYKVGIKCGKKLRKTQKKAIFFFKLLDLTLKPLPAGFRSLSSHQLSFKLNISTTTTKNLNLF